MKLPVKRRWWEFYKSSWSEYIPGGIIGGDNKEEIPTLKYIIPPAPNFPKGGVIANKDADLEWTNHLKNNNQDILLELRKSREI